MSSLKAKPTNLDVLRCRVELSVTKNKGGDKKGGDKKGGNKKGGNKKGGNKKGGNKKAPKAKADSKANLKADLGVDPKVDTVALEAIAKEKSIAVCSTQNICFN
jgi:hypothetical protein